MSRTLDLTGQRFGRWTVTSRAPHPAGEPTRWWCQCSCGSPTFVPILTHSLRRGTSKSCGCWAKELAAQRVRAKPIAVTKRTPETVAAVKARRAAGESLRSIARDYKVDHSTIRNWSKLP